MRRDCSGLTSFEHPCRLRLSFGTVGVTGRAQAVRKAGLNAVSNAEVLADEVAHRTDVELIAARSNFFFTTLGEGEMIELV